MRSCAGKTTTIKILEGFQSPTAGTVRLAVGGLALSLRFFRWDPTRPEHAKRVPAPSTSASYE